MTRISVWLSLARIYPPQHGTRRLSFVFVALFSVLGVALTIAGVISCPGSKWGVRFRYDICLTLQATGHSSQYEDLGMATGVCKDELPFSMTILR